MDQDTLLARRLATQGLSAPVFRSPEDAVRSLLCVQSQDAPLARWSLAMRTGQPTDDQVRAAIDDGRIVRTHVLRPTWHYVLAEDLRWLLALTSPKVRSGMTARHRQLGLDDPAVVSGLHDTLAGLLAGGRSLTRRQLQTTLARDDLRGERLGHLLMLAELDGLVCSGPLADGQHTYALVDEWVPSAPVPERDEALRDLVLRYFTGHGPATVAHLMRWATPTKREIATTLDDLGDRVASTEVAGDTFWHPPVPPAAPVEQGTWLLPVFDEAYLSYPGSNYPRQPRPSVGGPRALVRRVRRRRGRQRPARRGLVEAQGVRPHHHRLCRAQSLLERPPARRGRGAGRGARGLHRPAPWTWCSSEPD